MLLLNVNMDIAFDIVQIFIFNATCPVVALVVPTVLRTRKRNRQVTIAQIYATY